MPSVPQGQPLNYPPNALRVQAGPVYLGDGRMVGKLQPDGSLVKRVRANHLLGRPAAICWAGEVVEAARRRGCTRMEVTHEDGRVFRCDLATFDRFWTPVDRGFGAQRGLPLGYWSCNGNPAPALVQQERQATRHWQLDLFGEVAA